MFYSKSTGGFYDATIHGDDIPADAVEITIERHSELLNGQTAGKRIVADENGFPVLADQLPPSYDEVSFMARTKRDALLVDIYDKGVLMIQRAIRLNGDVNGELAEKLHELDQYAVALQGIPEQSGFPHNIDWPIPPTKDL